MPDRAALRKLWALAASVLVIAALPAWMWGARAVGSVLAGGLWNLASLWCLTRLLGAWLMAPPPVASAEGGSAPGRRSAGRRQVVGWLALKGALLALLIGVILRAPWLSFIGFGIGFTVVLIIIVASFALHSRRLVAGQSHGR